MKIFSRIDFWRLSCLTIGAVTSLSIATLVKAQDLPDDWANMEIEAKWTISEEQFEILMSFFSDEAEHFGYVMNVRWGGISRKFVDVYYDVTNDELSEAQHSLRHRTRYSSTPLATNNSVQALGLANWNEDWQRVQYKSTPCNIGAVWFRVEAGACRVRSSYGGTMCHNAGETNANTVIFGSLPSHAGMALMARDHPDLLLTDLQPSSHVFDYRYRVLFEREGVEAFELSLDRVATTDIFSGGTVRSFEAELEIVSTEISRSDVENLILLSEVIQERFSLEPSLYSKAGVGISACQ